MKNFKFIKNKYFWIFLVIFALGSFLRAYNFTPWLHFELDQSRDAYIVESAIGNGPEELPLLGPRASGNKLRLGPAFYYIQYIGAKIFGNTPQGIAYPVLIFSIFSIPLFYFFVKRYFNQKISLGLTALFSSSLFFVTYSRFAWNPNIIPFFVLLILFALLKVVDRKEKKNGWWLVILSLALGILVQLHFLAAISFVAVTFIFLAYKRPKVKSKFWIMAIITMFFLNSPMIINEAMTGGDNAKMFFESASKKSSKEDHSFVDKSINNYLEHSLGYWMIVSGNQKGELFSVTFSGGDKGYVQCDQHCRSNLSMGIIALTIFTLGILLLLVRLKKERDFQKKNFLILILIWLAVTFILFIPLSYKISPRFFLVQTGIPFVIFGLIFDRISQVTKDKNKISLFAITALVGSNLFFAYQYFNQLDKSSEENIEIEEDRMLKQKVRVTLEQQNEIADYLKMIYNKNGYPVFFKGQNEFHRAIAYLLDERGVPRDAMSSKRAYREGNYFIIMRTQSDLDYFRKKYGESYNFVSRKEFGTLSVWELDPKEEAIIGVKIDQSELERSIDGVDESSDAKRYKWKEIF